jgi:hypothetical protein
MVAKYTLGLGDFEKRPLLLFSIVEACIFLSPFCIFVVKGAVSSSLAFDASGRLGSYNCLALDFKSNPDVATVTSQTTT